MWVLLIVLWSAKTNIFLPSMQIPGFIDRKSCVQFAEQKASEIFDSQNTVIWTCINQK